MQKFCFNSQNDLIGLNYDCYSINLTKKMAEEMLTFSIGNRNLNKDNIKSLIRDMNNNEYYYDTPNSGIAFNKDGKLVNGHHTLTAFLESNLDHITVTMLTGTNHLDKCDTGKSRSLKDSAIMSGNYKCADVCKLGVNILRIQNGRTPCNTGSKKEFANIDVFNFCNENIEKLRQINDDIRNYKKKINKKNEGIGKYPKSEESVLGALIWELTYEESYTYEVVKDFAFGIITVNTHPNKVVDKFRKKICKDARLSNKNGAMTFSDFRNEFKNEFYKFAKSTISR